MKKPENLLTIPGIKSFCLGIVVSAALFLPLQASADDISLNLKNVTVKRAIAALQQSHYSLTVDASQIDMERRITVAAEDEPIENVLAQIFAGQDVSYEINGRSIVVTRRAVPRVAEKAVSRTLSGVVRDDKGATIVGATVVVKGTTTGVTTDIDGRYSLRVSADNPVLQISFVGYRTAEVAVAPAQTVVDVTLAASSIDVDEVVVVGYGTQSRHTLTTAVSKIAGSAVAAAPVTSVGDALKGKVAGMQVSTTNSLPGEAPTFLIRGGSSINQSNAPIVIVDGITRAMNDINPNDIESIEVLKDAAAAGIYGSRASNGVILITTKKGTVGKGPEIVFEGQIGWESPSRKWDFMNAEEFLSFVRPAIAESYNGASVLTSATAAGTGNGDGSIHTTRFLGDGEAVPAGWRSMTDPVTGRTIVFTDTDEQGHWFRDALWAKAYVGVTGGNENVKYAASVSYADDGGVVAMTDYSVFTMHGSADFKISKRLSASTTFDLSRSIRHPLVDNYFNSLGRGLLIAPTHRDYDADGNLLRGGDNKNCHTAMWYETYYDRECADKRATGNFNLNWEIVDGLTATAQYAMHDYNYRGSYYYKGNSLEQTRSCTETRTETLRDQFTAYLNFDRTFKRHQIGVTAGYDYMAERYRYLTANSTYAPSDKVPVLQSGGNFTASNKDTKEVLISYFGRVNYNFDKRYILSFTARADGSSKFAPGNKWGFFPAGAAAWNVSDEKFWNVRPINDLKLRVSYGMTGNNGIGLYDAYGSYSTAQNYAGHSTTIASAMANSALRWETTTQFDIGFDLGMFQNRLRIVADYYNKVTDNMIFSITLPDTSAYSSVKANVGSARFSGFELEVHSINVQKKNFTWTTDLTYTYNRNRVLSLPDVYRRRRPRRMAHRRLHDDRERLPLRRHGRGRTAGTHLRLQDRGHHPVAGRGRRGALRQPVARLPPFGRLLGEYRFEIQGAQGHRRLRVVQPRGFGAPGRRARADLVGGYVLSRLGDPAFGGRYQQYLQIQEPLAVGLSRLRAGTLDLQLLQVARLPERHGQQQRQPRQDGLRLLALSGRYGGQVRALLRQRSRLRQPQLLAHFELQRREGRLSLHPRRDARIRPARALD